MQMKLEDAIANHRKMWHGIAKHIKDVGIKGRSAGDIKQLVLEELFPELEGKHVAHNCFLCNYGLQYENGHHGACYYCPLLKRDGGKGCLNGLFRKFTMACNMNCIETASRLAKDIAELPVVNQLYVKDGINSEQSD